MSNLLLLDVPPSKPSLRVRLSEFKARHRILTHYCRDIKEAPWMAMITEPGETRSLPVIVLEEGDQGMSATGKGELSAIRELCRMNEIRCDL